MTALSVLQTLQQDLIRKTLNQSLFIQPWVAGTNISTATLFDATTGDLKSGSLTGWKDMGYIDNSGVVFARAVSTSDVTSAQSVTPTRTDITGDTTSVTVLPQETNQTTVATYLNVAPSTIVQPVNGVIRVDKPPLPTLRYWQVLSIAVDELSNGEVVMMRFLPKALVTSYADQTFAANTDNVVTWGVTYQGYKEDTLGFTESWIFGGAGWLARKAAMGM